FRVTQMRIVQRCQLGAVVIDQVGIFFVEPAVLYRLFVQVRPRVGSGERNLQGVGVDLAGEANRLFDGLPRFAGKPKDERAVDGYSEVVAISGEPPGNLDQHALFDVVEDLLVARFVSDQQQPQPVVTHYLQSLASYIGLGIARPRHAETSEPPRDRFGTPRVIGEGIV